MSRSRTYVPAHALAVASLETGSHLVRRCQIQQLHSQIDTNAEKRLLRKLDFIILPQVRPSSSRILLTLVLTSKPRSQVTLLFLFNFIDRLVHC